MRIRAVLRQPRWSLGGRVLCIFVLRYSGDRDDAGNDDALRIDGVEQVAICGPVGVDEILQRGAERDLELAARLGIEQGAGATATPVASAVNGADVRFWVADTGPGISEEHLEHLFDRFWQASRTDRRGAGLGFAIAKALVEAHGGRIWVDSRLGEGTIVYFEIPRAQPSQLGQPDERQPIGDTA